MFQTPETNWLEVIPLEDIGPIKVTFGQEVSFAPEGLEEHLFGAIEPDVAEVAA